MNVLRSWIYQYYENARGEALSPATTYGCASQASNLLLAEEGAINFIEETSFEQEKRKCDLDGIVVSLLDDDHHFWVWHPRSMEFELQKEGFIEILKALIWHFEELFLGVYIDTIRCNNCLGVELKIV